MRRRFLLLLLNAAVAGLLLDAGRTVTLPEEEIAAVASWEGEQELVTGSTATETTIRKFDAIGPSLFRRAILPASEAAAPGEPIRSARLLGVIEDQRSAIAVVAMPTNPTPIELRINMKVDGWRVTHIDRKGITLTRDGEHLALLLDPQVSSGADKR